MPKTTPLLVASVRALRWLLAVSALAPSLRAQPAPQTQTTTRFSLELTTGSGCPQGSDFVREVLARVPTALQVDGAAGDVGFHVEIASGGVSSLTVTLPQGSSRRELHDVTCEEATATFALIAALVLDARPEERLQAVADSAEPAPTKPPETKPPEPPPEAPPTPREHQEKPPTPREASRGELHFGLNAGLGVESAVAPTPPPAGLVGVSVLMDRFGVLSPELRAEFLGTTSKTDKSDNGTVRLRLWAGRFSACPLRFRLSPSLHLATCGTFDAGVLFGDGATGSDPSFTAGSNKMTWLAVGLAARGELRLSQVFNLELLASAKRLIHDDVFTVQNPPNPDLQVYNVPAYSVGLQVGLGVRL